MRKLAIGLPLVAGVCALLLAGGVPAQDAALPARAVARLREKLNPEFPAWSPTQVYERVAEHLAAFQADLVARSGAVTPIQKAIARRHARKEASYLVYFDLSDVPRPLLPSGIAALLFTVNTASSAPFASRPQPVPGTDNRLYFADFRHFNWTAKVLEKIAEKDPYFREPVVAGSPAAFVRETIGNRVLKAGWLAYYVGDATEFLKADQVRADDAFYYQLLYAGNSTTREVTRRVPVTETYTATETRKQTFRDNQGRAWTQDVTVPVKRERTVLKEKKVRIRVAGAVPQNTQEFQKFWRIDSAIKDARDFFADRGAVIDEGRSQVSYANRIIQRVRANLGTYWRTFDVFRTQKKTDYLEELPVPLQDRDFQFDAGEHIFQDPKGNQVYFLTNGKDQGEARVEFGDPRVVRDNMSGHRTIVLTFKSCVACHDQGIIPMENEIKTVLKGGAKLFLRHDRVVDKQAFYLKEINRLIAEDNAAYAEFVRECNGLTPQENAQQYQRFRQWYIAPVTPAQAARELGVEVAELQDAVSVSPKIRIGRFVTDGVAIPRTVWEATGYQEAALAIIEYRKSVNHDRRQRGVPPVPNPGGP